MGALGRKLRYWGELLSYYWYFSPDFWDFPGVAIGFSFTYASWVVLFVCVLVYACVIDL